MQAKVAADLWLQAQGAAPGLAFRSGIVAAQTPIRPLLPQQHQRVARLGLVMDNLKSDWNFSEQLYEKRGFEAKMQDLVGDLKLDDRLRQQGEDDRKERERCGWDAVHWRYGMGSTDDERGIRW